MQFIDPLYAFVFFGLFSPGPNVILLSASGARFGFRRSLPHLIGVVFGVGIIAGLTGFGIAAVLESLPKLAMILKLIAAIWILWMAWKLYHAAAPQKQVTDKPFSFVQAVLFQWINPKLWAVALAASSGYAAGLSPVYEAFRLASAFSGLNLFVCLFWVYAGSLLAYLLKTPAAWLLFLRIMSVVLAGSAALIFV